MRPSPDRIPLVISDHRKLEREMSQVEAGFPELDDDSPCCVRIVFGDIVANLAKVGFGIINDDDLHLRASIIAW